MNGGNLTWKLASAPFRKLQSQWISAVLSIAFVFVAIFGSVLVKGIVEEQSSSMKMIALGGAVRIDLGANELGDDERNFFKASTTSFSEASVFTSMVSTTSDEVLHTNPARITSVDQFYPLNGSAFIPAAADQKTVQTLLAKNGENFGAIVSPDLASRMGVEVGEIIEISGMDFTFTAPATSLPGLGLEENDWASTILIAKAAQIDLINSGGLSNYENYLTALVDTPDQEEWELSLRRKLGERLYDIRYANDQATFDEYDRLFLGLASFLIAGVILLLSVTMINIFEFLKSAENSIRSTLSGLGVSSIENRNITLLRLALSFGLAWIIATGLILLGLKFANLPSVGLGHIFKGSHIVYGLEFAFFNSMLLTGLAVAVAYRNKIGLRSWQSYAAVVLIILIILLSAVPLIPSIQTLRSALLIWVTGLIVIWISLSFGLRILSKISSLLGRKDRISKYVISLSTLRTIITLTSCIAIVGFFSGLERSTAELLRQTQEQTQKRYYILDVLVEQSKHFEDFMSKNRFEDLQSQNMINGRITTINGQFISGTGEGSVGREWPIYFSDREGSKVSAVNGKWWDSFETHNVVAIESRYAREHGIQRGDRISIQAGGINEVFEVRVIFETSILLEPIKPNIILNENAQGIFSLLTTYSFAASNINPEKLSELVSQFPNVDLISTQSSEIRNAAMLQVTNRQLTLMNYTVWCVSFVAILIFSLFITLRRQKDHLIYKALGAGKRERVWIELKKLLYPFIFSAIIGMVLTLLMVNFLMKDLFLGVVDSGIQGAIVSQFALIFASLIIYSLALLWTTRSPK